MAFDSFDYARISLAAAAPELWTPPTLLRPPIAPPDSGRHRRRSPGSLGGFYHVIPTGGVHRRRDLSCGFASAQGTARSHPRLRVRACPRETSRSWLASATCAKVRAPHSKPSRRAPPLRLEFELENAPRSDQDSSFDSAEATLSLASVIERGGKREARRAVADAAAESLKLQGEQRRADLLAEVARRYLDVVAAQSMADSPLPRSSSANEVVTQRRNACVPARRRIRCASRPRRRCARAMLQRERCRRRLVLSP